MTTCSWNQITQAPHSDLPLGGTAVLMINTITPPQHDISVIYIIIRHHESLLSFMMTNGSVAAGVYEAPGNENVTGRVNFLFS